MELIGTFRDASLISHIKSELGPLGIKAPASSLCYEGQVARPLTEVFIEKPALRPKCVTAALRMDRAIEGFQLKVWRAASQRFQEQFLPLLDIYAAEVAKLDRNTLSGSAKNPVNGILPTADEIIAFKSIYVQGTLFAFHRHVADTIGNTLAAIAFGGTEDYVADSISSARDQMRLLTCYANLSFQIIPGYDTDLENLRIFRESLEEGVPKSLQQEMIPRPFGILQRLVRYANESGLFDEALQAHLADLQATASSYPWERLETWPSGMVREKILPSRAAWGLKMGECLGEFSFAAALELIKENENETPWHVKLPKEPSLGDIRAMQALGESISDEAAVLNAKGDWILLFGNVGSSQPGLLFSDISFYIHSHYISQSDPLPSGMYRYPSGTDLQRVAETKGYHFIASGQGISAYMAKNKAPLFVPFERLDDEANLSSVTEGLPQKDI